MVGDEFLFFSPRNLRHFPEVDEADGGGGGGGGLVCPATLSDERSALSQKKVKRRISREKNKHICLVQIYLFFFFKKTVLLFDKRKSFSQNNNKYKLYRLPACVDPALSGYESMTKEVATKGEKKNIRMYGRNRRPKENGSPRSQKTRISTKMLTEFIFAHVSRILP